MMSREHRFVAVGVALFLLVELACGSSPSAPTGTGPFVVTGQVLDFRTNAGVPGATVVFGDLSRVTPVAGDSQSITDSSGSYQLSLMAGEHFVYVDNAYSGLARVRSGFNRADLLVHPAGCIVRYGTIADASTGRPLAGASVSLVGVTATSGFDGAYRLDFGCRAGLGSGTIFMSITRAGYQDRAVSMGRGESMSGVIRQDVDLDPR